MITPTNGRVVWVSRPRDTEDLTQPEAALIVYVHNDRLINVAGFNAVGRPFALTSLTLVQDDEPKPEGNFAAWMPFQKGQAAKTESLERQAADADAFDRQRLTKASVGTVKENRENQGMDQPQHGHDEQAEGKGPNPDPQTEPSNTPQTPKSKGK